MKKAISKEKVKEAVALQYSADKDTAPRIVAAGKGDVAEKIINTAKGNDVPVYEDEALAQALGQLKIGEKIPSELYEVVAEILVFISNMDKDLGTRDDRKK